MGSAGSFGASASAPRAIAARVRQIEAWRHGAECAGGGDSDLPNLAAAYPENDTGLQMGVDSLMEKSVGRVRLALQVLLGSVGWFC